MESFSSNDKIGVNIHFLNISYGNFSAVYKQEMKISFNWTLHYMSAVILSRFSVCHDGKSPNSSHLRS